MYNIHIDDILNQPKIFRETVSKMPTDGLVYEVQAIARNFAGVLNSNENYVLGSMFTSMGTALGKDTTVHHNAFVNKTNLYTMLLGESGDAKSPTIDFVMDYLNKVDQENELKYEKQYDCAVESEQKILPLFNDQMIASNCTIEKLYSVLYATRSNKKTGVMLHLDEATTFFSPGATMKSKTGAVVPHILTMFSAPYLKVDRLYLGKPLYIENPMLSILAATQYENLGNIYNGFRGSGFSSRWLFVLPSEEVAIVMKDDLCKRFWIECLERAMDFDGQDFEFASSKQIDEIFAALKVAKKEMGQYDKELAAYLIKQNIYLYRFALLVHCLNHFIVGNRPPQQISEEEVDYAFRLCMYFTSNAAICLDLMDKQMQNTNLTGKQILQQFNQKWKVTNFTALSEATSGALDRAYASKCINLKL